MSTYGGTYKTGTVALTNGGTAAVGTGTMWSVPIEEGDTIVAQGLIGIIASVDSDTGITLEASWPGATASGVSYLILKNSALRADVTFVQKKVRELILQLQGSGLIYWVTESVPDNIIGEEGQYAIKIVNGGFALWQKQSGVWVQQGSNNQAPTSAMYLYEHCI